MSRRTFSGFEVCQVLVTVGIIESRRTTGYHAQLYSKNPTNKSNQRHVTVPLHDELRTGTPHRIADEAGVRYVDAFCNWLDRHR